VLYKVTEGLKKLKFWKKRESSEDELSVVFLDHIIKLQTKLFERDLFLERVEYTLRERIAELEVQLKERDSESEKMEDTLRQRIAELEMQLKARGSESKKIEETLRDQIKEMERVQKETEGTLCAKIDKLSNENEERMKIVEEIHDEEQEQKKRILGKYIDGENVEDPLCCEMV
jgi:septal ring factor EnvC (AmiA/AmiB activator)